MNHRTPLLRGTLGAGALGAALAVSAAARQPQAAARLGVDTTNFDRSVRPQDDFFRFVNGGWLKKTEIPADRSSFGSFDQLATRASQALRTIIEEAAARRRRSREATSRRWATCTGATWTRRASRRWACSRCSRSWRASRTSPARRSFPELFAYLARRGVQTPVGFFVTQDQKHATRYIATLSQCGLGLPDRDYYLKDGDKLERRCARRTATTSPPCSASPASRTRRRRRGTSWRWRRRSREHQWERAKNRDREATYNQDAWPSSTRSPRASPGAACSRPRAPRRRPGSSSASPTTCQAFDGILQQTPLRVLEAVPHLQGARRLRRRAARRLPPGALRLRRPHAAGAAGAASPLEARGGRGGRRARRGHRPHVRRAPLHARAEGAHAGAGGEPARRLPRGDRRARAG